MAQMNVGGQELFYERGGAGEPLLLIQGMSGTHRSWGEPFVAALERHFDVIRYDHRGIGRSAVVNDPFTIVDLADDAIGLLDSLGVESAHVLGISMGSMVAQELALHHPDRLRTLTLGGTYCGGPEARFTDDAVVERLAMSLAPGDENVVIRTAYECNLSAAFWGDEANYPTFHAMAAGNTGPERIPAILTQLQAVHAHDASARLAEIGAPTLVIHGDEDLILNVGNGRQVASLIPGARLEEMTGVGHMFWWERPERSAELLVEHALAARTT